MQIGDKAGAVVIGGRRFLPLIDGNLAHDLEVLALKVEAGISELEVRDGEAPEDFIVRIQDELWRSRKVLQLLGCLLIPEELDPDKWTPQDAEDTARFLGTVKGTDKAKAGPLVLDLILHFFESGMLSFWTSRSSSAATGHPEGQGESAEPTATATGVR